ncbi:MAG TPA: TonB-dependent receptor [Terriglobia bacterium]|nr:TonB-dependent receptor [Terriglobia bacterium]
MKRYFYSTCWLSFFVLALPASLLAQSEATIRGTVTAKADGSRMPDSELRLEDAPLSAPLRATANADGSFTFPRLVPGRYTLSASHLGFQDEVVQLQLKPREVRNVVLELPLRPVAQSIDVKVSPELLVDTYSPSSKTLDRDEIERLPLNQRNNLPDMIVMSAPGMIRSHDDFVHVRGNEIALNTFINGVSFWENPHSVFSSGINPGIVQSLNVMTGSFPAEYGNRFGGVIDVVTKSGFSMNNEGTLSLEAGNGLRHSAAIEYGGHRGKSAYYFQSAGFESARFLSPNDVRAIHDTGRGSHNFLQVDFNATPKDIVKFIVMADGTNFQIPKTSLDDEVRPNAHASERTRAFSTVLTWSHVISSETHLTASFYQRSSRSLLLAADDPLATAAQNEQHLFTAGIKSDLTHTAGRHTVKAGIDLVLLRPDETLSFDEQGFVSFSSLEGLPDVDFQNPGGSPIVFAGRKSGGQMSGYVQDTIEITRNLSVDVGLRLDRYSLAMSETQLSPRLNAAYRVAGTRTVLHASYNHFFVPPAVENILISSAGLTQFLEGDPGSLPALRPITEDQFEVGVTHPLTNHVHVGLSSYYRASKHPVHTVLLPDSRVYAYANFDKGKAYGMEVKIEMPVIQRLGLSAYLNYALSRVYLWDPVTAGFVEELHHIEDSGRFLAPMNQDHTLNAGFNYRHKSGFWAGMTFEYGSGTPTESAVEGMEAHVPGHFTENVSTGIDLLRRDDHPRLALQFNIENLSNQIYKVSQESAFSPGEYFNPRVFSGSMKVHF